MPRELWDPTRFAHPRFVGIADLLARIADCTTWPSIAQLNARFAPELAAAGVQLVAAGKLEKQLVDGVIDPRSLYEVVIVETHAIPTRPENAHDLLNALAWLAFPASKRVLTAQLAALQRERARGRATLPPTRSRAHDRLALIDEGAIVRSGAAVWIFGHAIYEHAYRGEFDVRASVIECGERIDATGAHVRAHVDRALAEVLGDPARLERAFQRGAGVAIDDATLARE